jgi:hypothetical protein
MCLLSDGGAKKRYSGGNFGGGSRAMPTTRVIPRILAAFPDREEELRPFIERAARYRHDCGCHMGGLFLISSIAIATAYIALSTRSGPIEFGQQVLAGALFVVLATAVGKTVGIALARIRLALLHRELTRRYSIRGG